jgi:hypothetical protein
MKQAAFASSIVHGGTRDSYRGNFLDEMSGLLAKEFLERAAECAEMAEQQDDQERKREYSDLATMWRLIAQNSEKTGCRLEATAVDSR